MASGSIGSGGLNVFLRKSDKSYLDWLNCHSAWGMQAVRRKYQKNLQLVRWIRNDAIQQFGGGEDPRNTGSGVGARTAKVEPANILRDVVRSEPGALSQNGFELESGADVRIESGFEISRGEDQLADEVFAKVGNNRFLEGGQNAIRISFFLLFPIDLIPRGSEMRDGRKDVKTFVALGG